VVIVFFVHRLRGGGAVFWWRWWGRWSVKHSEGGMQGTMEELSLDDKGAQDYGEHDIIVQSGSTGIYLCMSSCGNIGVIVLFPFIGIRDFDTLSAKRKALGGAPRPWGYASSVSRFYDATIGSSGGGTHSITKKRRDIHHLIRLFFISSWRSFKATTNNWRMIPVLSLRNVPYWDWEFPFGDEFEARGCT